MSDDELLVSLRERGYRFYERWHTSAVLGFVRREIGCAAWPLKLAFALLALLLAVTLGLAAQRIGGGRAWFVDVLLPFGLGTVGIAALIVPHELLHGLAFKLLGAPRIVYGADWSKLVFHAAAPGFPIGRAGMAFVALAPFAVITPLLVALGVVLGGVYAFGSLGALVMHTQGCLGDFAMVNFFERAQPGSTYITYDESGGESFVLLVRRDTRIFAEASE